VLSEFELAIIAARLDRARGISLEQSCDRQLTANVKQSCRDAYGFVTIWDSTRLNQKSDGIPELTLAGSTRDALGSVLQAATHLPDVQPGHERVGGTAAQPLKHCGSTTSEKLRVIADHRVVWVVTDTDVIMHSNRYVRAIQTSAGSKG
jgi:hypothetical protein